MVAGHMSEHTLKTFLIFYTISGEYDYFKSKVTRLNDKSKQN